MKLCIADPPYLGRGAALYGPAAENLPSKMGKGTKRHKVGDGHPDAGVWDDPVTHQSLVKRLIADYDGWAIALNPENLHDYLRWVPESTRVCAWVKPDAYPAGRLIRSWEPVLIYVPHRGRGDRQVRDGVTIPRSMGSAPNLIGAKPPAWTRWVLDLLGYDPETDTVDDLFHGSGAVAAEVAQGVLL